MKRAVAFCQVIEIGKEGKTHKVSSKQIARMFQSVVEAYQETDGTDKEVKLVCEAEHVDGGMNASEKEAKLDWLKAEASENTCRILSNVRCLSEGVDVPALDAVLFLTPRNSQVDVVQSVGRVMRNAPNKKRGYVILPVVVPAGVEPHAALNDNKTYAVVWQVLQALRSHDDRFDAMVNKLDLIGKDVSKMEVIAITDKISRKQDKSNGEKKGDNGKGNFTIGEAVKKSTPDAQGSLQFEIGEIEKAIYAKLVQKVGNRHHWEDWANDIAKIARTHIDRINAILENQENKKERKAFAEFAAELRDDLNDSIADGEIVEMLAQHLITKPVFDALFSDYSFASHNPMSQAMQAVLYLLEEHSLGKEADTLQSFYESVKDRASGIENAAGKQKIVVELYDKFFRNAFPKMTERLGIVYTPVEVVDFIIHSVNDVLQREFGQTLGSKGVHILDPFTGTGTFITRLLQSGLIKPDELAYKYKNEIHANELVLLAYYIAAINIEAVYHSMAGGKYLPFEGICLTDTFQMYEKEDLVDALLVDNSARRKRQKKLDIRVIMGNPPYAVGQDSANDDNKKVAYPTLDERIRSTYADRSNAMNKNALYDSYIRAIRWASDRIGQSGVIGFVTNAGYVDANTADGLRKTLLDEFSSIYVFHLRGNQRTSGELSRKEGGKIFGSGSRAPIAISILVKNPQIGQIGQVFFHDIGDYLTREEKLGKVKEYGSIRGIADNDGWRTIVPDAHGDWLNQRDDGFGEYISLGNKDGKESITIFQTYSSGVKTNRDAWCYNSSQSVVEKNMSRMIDFYNSEVERFIKASGEASIIDIEGFVDNNSSNISWNRSLRNDLARKKPHNFSKDATVQSLYRPFFKEWLYFNRQMNNDVSRLPVIFPNKAAKNLTIMVSGIGTKNAFSLFISDCIPCFDFIEKGQCFPLFLYESGVAGDGLFNDQGKDTGDRKKDGITDAALDYFKAAYPSETMSKEDIFYYVYGLLHAPQYREKYADNLSKELPRIPRVQTANAFWKFSQAGRKLAALHVNYETVEKYPLQIVKHGVSLKDADYRVEKMKYGKNGKDKDLTTVHYNEKITLKGIPLEAYEYVVNGKSAIDWVIERQCVKTDSDSGIVNDANDWAVETMHNPRYSLELLQRVITVSLETMKIVKALPPLDIKKD